MKKLISLLLSFSMIACLVSCGGSNSTPDKTDSTPTETAAPASPSAETPEASGNGDIDFVAGIVPSTDIAILVKLYGYVEEQLEARGIQFELSSAQFDNTKYIELIENYVTMGADIIVMNPMDTSAIQDAVLSAENAGTHIVFIGSPPDYGDQISGGIYSDYYEVGHLTAEMACAWAKEKYPDMDKIGIAITVAESDADSISRTTGIRDAIEADEVCYVSYESFNATAADDGYSFAEETMNAYPDTRVFLMYESDPAIGVDNFVQAYVQSDSNLSIADFGVFAVGYSENAASLVDASASDESALRGLGCYSALEPGEPVVEVLNAIIDGQELPYWLIETCYTINSFGF